MGVKALADDPVRTNEYAETTTAGNKRKLVPKAPSLPGYEILGNLIAAGWKDKFALETDPDLDAIRKEAGFASLVANLPTPK